MPPRNYHDSVQREIYQMNTQHTKRREKHKAHMDMGHRKEIQRHLSFFP